MQAIIKTVTCASKCCFRNGTNCNLIASVYCGSEQYPSDCPLLDMAIAVQRAKSVPQIIEVKEA